MQVLRFHLLELEKVYKNLFAFFAMFDKRLVSNPTITITNQGINFPYKYILTKVAN